MEKKLSSAYKFEQIALIIHGKLYYFKIQCIIFREKVFQ